MFIRGHYLRLLLKLIDYKMSLHIRSLKPEETEMFYEILGIIRSNHHLRSVEDLEDNDWIRRTIGIFKNRSPTGGLIWRLDNKDVFVKYAHVHKKSPEEYFSELIKGSEKIISERVRGLNSGQNIVIETSQDKIPLLEELGYALNQDCGDAAIMGKRLY